MKNAEWLLKCEIPFDQIYCKDHKYQFQSKDNVNANGKYRYDIIWKVNCLEPLIVLGHVDCESDTNIKIFQKWLDDEVDTMLINRYKEAIGKLNIL